MAVICSSGIPRAAHHGQDVATDVHEIPVGLDLGQEVVVEPVHVAPGVMGENESFGPARLAQTGDGVDARLGGAVGIDAEAVHAQSRPGPKEFFEVGEIGRVPAVADHHPTEVDALLGEDPLLVEAALRVGVGVGRYRNARLAMDPGHRSQHPLDARL